MKSDYYDIKLTPNKHEYDNAIRLYKVRQMEKKRFAFYDFEHGQDWGKRSDIEYVNKKWKSFIHEYPQYDIHINPQNYIYEMYHLYDIQFSYNTAGLGLTIKCGMFEMFFSLRDLDVENAIPLLQALNEANIKNLAEKVEREEEHLKFKKLQRADACEEIKA
ncbi:hypothetical protein LCGC14_0677240 [marine sediment metagenome]|uniref:Uncharacterized protein n=1 Tax=marine sediment metagenome TaxID=412755 RepID=A0A0F9QPA7_9ZZZZ